MTTPNRKPHKQLELSRGVVAPLQGLLKVSPKSLRRELGLTQAEFWAPIGVSQSGGSRYEAGRKLPAAISTLLHLVHIERLDLIELGGDDQRVGKYLRETDPEAYAALLNTLKRIETSD